MTFTKIPFLEERGGGQTEEWGRGELIGREERGEGEIHLESREGFNLF